MANQRLEATPVGKSKAMNRVMTVTGWQDVKQLGFCQCHEHLMISKGVSSVLNPDLQIDNLSKSIEEVRRFKKMGGNTIVDAQPGGCNRMESELHEISRITGVNIIACTGFHKLCFYPDNHWIFSKSEEELFQLFTHELGIGMFNRIDEDFFTSQVPYRAGMIKSAIDLEGLTPVYERLFRAAASASIAADVPFMVHIEQGSDPEGLLSFLLSCGISPRRIIFCHMDRTIEALDYYQSVLNQGITLEFDTIGRFKYHTDEEEAALILELLNRGYEHQLLCSLDTTSARLKSYTPDAVGLDYLFSSFFPLLIKYGVSTEQIFNITNQNSVRIFNK